MRCSISITGDTDNDDDIFETLEDITDDFHSAVEQLEILNSEIEDAVSDISDHLDAIEEKIRELCSSAFSDAPPAEKKYCKI